MVQPCLLVRCTAHNESCCWVQLDGEHISTRKCTCFGGVPRYLCPIDGHALRYLIENPEWTEPAPNKMVPFDQSSAGYVLSQCDNSATSTARRAPARSPKEKSEWVRY